MLSCVASAGLFFRVREEISRMREGRKEEEPSPSRVSLAWPLKKKITGTSAMYTRHDRLQQS